MDDNLLYTETDPGYSETPLFSGIPPPSVRDIQYSRYNQQQQSNDISKYNPQRQVHLKQQQQYDTTSRYSPYPTQQHQRQHPHPHYQRSNPTSQLQPVVSEAPPPPSTSVTATATASKQTTSNNTFIKQPLSKLNMRTSTDFISCENNEGSIRLSLQELCSSIEMNSSTADYDFLCSNDLVKTAIELRDKGTRVPDDVRNSAKKRSNPFSYISESPIFVNYSAIKLASLDATFHLTPSFDETNSKSFLFADICGGPGGFTEYLTWKIHQSKGTSRGYGITLRSESNPQDHWHLEKFSSNIPVNFTQVDGYDGTGDIYKKNNILEFDAVISNNTKKRGVDLVVADGEYGSLHKHQHLLLCEIITMLTCLRLGGNFVCKFFDIFDEWTADLLWLLYQLFDSICITKPLTSDPTLSERYVICKGFKHQHPTKLIDLLLSINESILQQQDNDKKLGCFISRSLLEKDEDFMDYVRMRNMKFLLQQIDALEQLEVYIADSDRPCTYDQESIRKQCLQEWHLPA